MALVIVSIGVLVVLALWILGGVRIVRPFERGVVERFGRFRRTAEPGLRAMRPIVDTMHMVDMREQVLELQLPARLQRPAHRRIVVHHCPFQDIAADRTKVCGTFVTTLIGELLGGVDVTHEAADDPVRCCTLEVREWDAQGTRS